MSSFKGKPNAEISTVVYPGLSTVLARLLFPKLRKRTGRLGGRGAPGSARAAILNFFAAVPPAELAPLLELFFEPLAGAFVPPAGFAEDLQAAVQAAGVGDDRWASRERENRDQWSRTMNDRGHLS